MVWEGWAIGRNVCDQHVIVRSVDNVIGLAINRFSPMLHGVLSDGQPKLEYYLHLRCAQLAASFQGLS